MLSTFLLIAARFVRQREQVDYLGRLAKSPSGRTVNFTVQRSKVAELPIYRLNTRSGLTKVRLPV